MAKDITGDWYRLVGLSPQDVPDIPAPTYGSVDELTRDSVRRLRPAGPKPLTGKALQRAEARDRQTLRTVTEPQAPTGPESAAERYARLSDAYDKYFALPATSLTKADLARAEQIRVVLADAGIRRPRIGEKTILQGGQNARQAMESQSMSPADADRAQAARAQFKVGRDFPKGNTPQEQANNAAYNRAQFEQAIAEGDIQRAANLVAPLLTQYGEAPMLPQNVQGQLRQTGRESLIDANAATRADAEAQAYMAGERDTRNPLIKMLDPFANKHNLEALYAAITAMPEGTPQEQQEKQAAITNFQQVYADYRAKHKGYDELYNADAAYNTEQAVRQNLHQPLVEGGINPVIKGVNALKYGAQQQLSRIPGVVGDIFGSIPDIPTIDTGGERNTKAASEFIGALIPLGAAAKGTGLAARLLAGRLAPTLTKNAVRAGRLIGAAEGAGAGTLLGAESAMHNQDNPQDALLRTLLYGAGGAPLGVISKVAEKGIGKLPNPLMRKGATIVNSVGHLVGWGGVDIGAAAAVGKPYTPSQAGEVLKSNAAVGLLFGAPGLFKGGKPRTGDITVERTPVKVNGQNADLVGLRLAETGERTAVVQMRQGNLVPVEVPVEAVEVVPPKKAWTPPTTTAKPRAGMGVEPLAKPEPQPEVQPEVAEEPAIRTAEPKERLPRVPTLNSEMDIDRAVAGGKSPMSPLINSLPKGTVAEIRSEMEQLAPSERGEQRLRLLLLDPVHKIVHGIMERQRLVTGGREPTAFDIADVFKGNINAVDAAPKLVILSDSGIAKVMQKVANNLNTVQGRETIELGVQRERITTKPPPPAELPTNPSVTPVEAQVGVETGKVESAGKPQGVAGKSTVVKTVTDMEAPGRYEVVEAADITPSHTIDLTPIPEHPAGYQGRNRGTAASTGQVTEITANMDVERLMSDYQMATAGPPTIEENGFTLAGNARTIAIKRRYASGQGQEYRDAVIRNAEKFGVDAQQVAAMNEPVLVRRVTIPEAQKTAFADAADISETSSKNVLEQAQADAAKISDKDLQLLRADDNGNLNTQENAYFLQGFTKRLGTTELQGFTNERGMLSQDGNRRLQAAILMKVYGQPELVNLSFVETDISTGKNLLSALLQLAPKLATMPERAQFVGKTAMEFLRLKQDGVKIGDYADQIDMFSQSRPDTETVELLKTLDSARRSKKAISSALTQYLDGETGGELTGQMSMFGSSEGKTVPKFGGEKPLAVVPDRVFKMEPVVTTEAPADAAPTADSPQFGANNTMFTAERYQRAVEMLQQSKGKARGAVGNIPEGEDVTSRLQGLVDIAGFHIEGGIRNFAEFSKAAIAQFGEVVEPLLREAWDTAARIYAKSAKEKKQQGERSFGYTVAGADVTPAEVGLPLVDKPFTYEPISNPTTMKAADIILRGKNAEADWQERIMKAQETAGWEDVAVGEKLIVQAINNGDYAKANKLTADLAEVLTASGRTVQAASLIQRMSPEGMLLYAQRQAGKMRSGRHGERTKQADKQTKELTVELDAVNREGAGALAPELNLDGGEALPLDVPTTGKPKPTGKLAKPTAPKEPPSAEQLLAQLVQDAAKPKEAKPLSEDAEARKAIDTMVRRLFEIAKEKLPEPLKRSTDPYAAMQEIVTNRNRYADVWGKAQAIVTEAFKDDPTALGRVKAYLERQANPVFADARLNGIITRAMKDSGYKIGDVVKDYFETGAHKDASLVEYIMGKTNLSGADAEYLAQYVTKRLGELTNAKKRAMLEARFKAPVLGKKATLLDSARLFTELSNIGAFSDPRFKQQMLDALPKRLQTALQRYLGDTNNGMERIVKEGMAATEKQKVAFAQQLANDLRITPNDARVILDAALKQFDAAAMAKRQQLLARMAPAEREAAQRMTAFDRLIAISDLGGFTYGELLPYTYKALRLPSMTPEDAALIGSAMRQRQALVDAAQTLDPAQYRKVLAESMHDEFFTDKQQAYWLKEFDKAMANTKTPIETLLQFSERTDTAVTANVLQHIANMEKATFAEKVKGLQRISMLLNAKTTLTRNPLGNVGMVGLGNTAQSLGAGIDALVSLMRGTPRTTFAPDVKFQGQAMKAGLKESWQDIRLGVDTTRASIGKKYEMPHHQVFERKALNTAEKAVGSLLTMGDRPFYRAAYEQALRDYKKRYGLTEDTPEAIEFAHQVGLEKTFQDVNAITKGMEALRKGLNYMSTGTPDIGYGTMVMPFAKTPANLLARALDYTVLGAGKAVREVIRGAGYSRSGKTFDQYEFVNHLSKSLTGLGIIAAGYLLAERGIIRGGESSTDSRRKRNFNRATGKQPYSFVIGGKTHTYDWAQPGSLLLAIGASLQHGGESKKQLADRLMDAVVSGGDSLFQISILQGLKGLTTQGTSVTKKLVDTTAGFASQAVPTIVGQTARTIDPVKRKQDSVTDTLMARTPFLSKLLPPNVNVKGEVERYEGGFLGQFLAPQTTRTITETAVDKELQRLSAAVGKDDVFPVEAPRKITSGDVSRELKDFEKSAYQQALGQAIQSSLRALFSSPTYQGLSDEVKAEIVASSIRSVAAEQRKRYIEAHPEYPSEMSAETRKLLGIPALPPTPGM